MDFAYPLRMVIGVLAFQGDVREHSDALSRSGCAVQEVRSVAQLHATDGLIIPGGESTVIGRFLASTGLREIIIEKAMSGFPIYGTCAGAIIMSKKLVHNNGGVQPLGLMDIAIERNAYGRQSESFEVDIPVKLGKETVSTRALFIRAPQIVDCWGGTEILGMYDGKPVFLRQGNLCVSTFHPELITGRSAIHEYFIKMAKEAQ